MARLTSMPLLLNLWLDLLLDVIAWTVSTRFFASPFRSSLYLVSGSQSAGTRRQLDHSYLCLVGSHTGNCRTGPS